MFWSHVARFIIKFRLLLLLTTGGITAFMAYKSSEIEITYDFLKVVPEDDPDHLYFKKFKKLFGEDGNIFVIGMQDKSVFTLEKFRELNSLCVDLKKVRGVNDIISLPTLKILRNDTVAQKFELSPLFQPFPATQEQLDSTLRVAEDTKFYEGLVLNKETDATLLAIAIEGKDLNSPRRKAIMDSILDRTKLFAERTNIDLHYAGLPYVRAIMVNEVQGEFKLFLVLAAVVTSLILFFFFRSLFAVFFTFMVIVVTVIWTMGTIVLLGYKITLLTGILPALIIVIGIPNCVYMYNKYHQEYKRHHNKIKALTRVVQKIGFLTFMTNANTAVGFIVLYFTNIIIIKEFGMVAGLISFATFIISLVVIPTMLYYLPPPSAKQLKHLDLRALRRINHLLEFLVLRQRVAIYVVSILLMAISVMGMLRLKTISYMVDDLPSKSDVKGDLYFFEQHFDGVMPLEIVIDFGKEKALRKPSNLKHLEELEQYLLSLKHVSPPLSILNIVKGAKQAYYGGSPDYYQLPNKQEMSFMRNYFTSDGGQASLLKAFVDSTQQQVRFTCKVADMGTDKMNELVQKNIEPKIKEIFAKELADTSVKFEAHVTGTTLLFLKGNQYLIDDLTESLIYALIFISLMMAFIFTNVKMILISLVPNIIPMFMTAGIMGIFDIPLKPSTALIFGISFGISIDSTIHYLSKFKQELGFQNGNVLLAVIKSLEEVGVSIIYTSIVLFCGFVIFSFSEFGGTVALGVLTSITLFFATFTNLILLPAILISFSKGNKRNLFHLVDGKMVKTHTEEDDVDLDLSKLEIAPEVRPDLEKEIKDQEGSQS